MMPTSPANNNWQPRTSGPIRNGDGAPQPNAEAQGDGGGYHQGGGAENAPVFGDWGTPDQALGRRFDAEEQPAATDWGDVNAARWSNTDERVVLTKKGKLAIIGGVLLMTIFIILAIWFGAPIVGRTWQPAGLVPAVVAWGVGWFVWEKWRNSKKVGALVAVACLFIPITLLGTFAWGVASSVQVDGKLYLATSQTAKAYNLLEEIEENREVFIEVDELIKLDPGAAQARFTEYDPLRKKIQAYSDKWSLYDVDGLPSGDFLAVLENARSANYFAGLALESKKTLISAQDERVAAELQAAGLAFEQSAVAMAGSMGTVASNYGFPWQ